MATIRMIWDGGEIPALEITTDYFKGQTNGYARATNYTESWTGQGLAYSDPGIVYPTGGLITSFSSGTQSGSFSLVITDIEYTLPPGTTVANFLLGMMAGRDEWSGNDHDNFFLLSVGGDSYHGGAGIDTLTPGPIQSTHYLQASTRYVREVDGALRATNFGTTTFRLYDVERIRFSDVSIALDLSGNAGEVARVLGAIFGADAVHNPVYFGIGLSLFDAGELPLVVTRRALDARLGPQRDAADVITLLYRNIANSNPSPDELRAYVDSVESGATTVEALAWAGAHLALNDLNIDLVGLASLGVAYQSLVD